MNEKLENKKLKICFVSLNSHTLLMGENVDNYGYIGGAEIQTVKIAKELRKRGYEISFITYCEMNNNNHSRKMGEINIVPAYNKNKIDNLSLLHKAVCIWRKMKKVDADIYYHHAGSAGITALFCRLNKKKAIIHLASDADVTGEIIFNRNTFASLLSKIGNWLDIKLSDKVISQTSFQKSKLKEKFNIDGVIVKNVIDTSLQFNKESIGDYLLWVGTIRPVKQPELLLKIAQLLPKYKFIMIGGESEDPELFLNIKNTSANIPNLDFIGFVPHDKIFDYYKKAILLINTSKTEGFPNVFLEALLCSVPVVSLNVDPDGIISKYNLGYHSGSFDQMINDTGALLQNKKLLQMMGKNGMKYVEKNHDIKKVADQYECLIRDLLKTSAKTK